MACDGTAKRPRAVNYILKSNLNKEKGKKNLKSVKMMQGAEMLKVEAVTKRVEWAEMSVRSDL